MTEKNIHLHERFPLDSSVLWYFVPEGFRDVSVMTSGFGCEIISLNKLCRKLKSSDVVRYYAPDAAQAAKDGKMLAHVRKRLEAVIGQQLTCPTLIKISTAIEGSATLYEFNDGRAIGPFVEDYLAKICPKRDRLDLPKPECRSNSRHRSLRTVFEEVECGAIAPKRKQDEEEIIDDIIRHLQLMNEIQLRSLGLDEESLRFILGKKRSYSRMRIDRFANILLED